MEALKAWFTENTGVAIGIIVGVVLVIVAVIVALVASSKKKARSLEQSKEGASEAQPAAEEATAEPVAEQAPAQEEAVAEPVAQEVVAEEAPAVEEPAPEAAQEPVAEEVVVEKKAAKPRKKPAKKQAEPVEEVAAEQDAQPEQAAVTEEPKAAEEAVAEEAPAAEEPAKAEGPKNTGKWLVYEKGVGEYVAHLYANNGKLLLTSEVYSTYKGALSGIATIKRNAEKDNFDMHCDKNGRYYYKLKSSTNKLLCVGEVYPSKQSCIKSIGSVRKFCVSAVMPESYIEDHTLMNYEPEGELQSEGTKGKWRIEPKDDMFIACLYANNGQLLLVSESYTTEVGAKSAMENIVKNVAECNFVIDRDKSRKYYWKLRNSVKSILCVGETYKTKADCISAIESVRRFCETSELVEEEEEE